MDTALPEQLIVGPGHVLYLAGWCFHNEQPVTRLEAILACVAYAVAAWALPRAGASGDSPCSGYWTLLPVPEQGAETLVEVGLRALARWQARRSTARRTEIAPPARSSANRNHNPRLKQVFKSAALTALCYDAVRIYYEGLVNDGMRPDVWTLLAKQKIDSRMTWMQQINTVQPKDKSVNICRLRVIRESKLSRFCSA